MNCGKSTGCVSIRFFHTLLSRNIDCYGGDFMKKINIVISETSLPASASGQGILQQAVTQWLIKELSLK